MISKEVADCVYHISLSEEEDYIHIKVEGKITIDVAASFSVDASVLGQEKGISNFLFDVREAWNASTHIENYKFANQEMRNLMLDPNVNSAVLVNKDDRSHDFIPVVVNNAGYSIRLFTELSEALEWLRSADLNPPSL